MKREKPKKDRPHLVATEVWGGLISIRILYPNKDDYCDFLPAELDCWMQGYNFTLEELTEGNKKHGFETHFLGNL